MAAHSQFSLLRQRRFAPLFWTQFLGAANDNLFKFAFTLLATYEAAKWGGGSGTTAGFIIGAIFIVPFILFSATSGQLSDKYDHASVMRFVRRESSLRLDMADRLAEYFGLKLTIVEQRKD